MQVFEANLFCFQFFGDEASHAFPLAEYYNLFTFFADDVADNIDTFIHLGVESRIPCASVITTGVNAFCLCLKENGGCAIFSQGSLLGIAILHAFPSAPLS